MVSKNIHSSQSPHSHNIVNSSSLLVPLEYEDLTRAEQHIFRQSQMDSFPEELEALRKFERIEGHSRLRRLSPFLDSDGIIRLHGRIDVVEDVTFSSKRPIIIDSKHPAVRLLIAYHHKKAAHANNELVINELRQTFWILGLRTCLRSIVSRCSWCIIRRSKSLRPPMGDLPPERLAHHRRPFTFVGLDYMGPITITVGRRHEKRYVALFTCLTSRAVHLEIVGSLSADSALMCLKRFISRRGKPAKILSDNGTAFTGANNILKRAMSEVSAEQKIVWSFIPPSSPHMGGAWERLVKSVKVALHAILQERNPKEELLYTALLEAEALVNSRPLTHVSFDPGDQEALTPFHFILGSSSPYHPIPVTTDDGDFLGRSDWRKSQRLADMFWRRWVKEYLPTLAPRQSPPKGDNTVTVGDLVLILDGSLPRGTWPRGRVAAVYPGRDGIIRVADVITAGGRLRRPLVKLVKLLTPSST